MYIVISNVKLQKLMLLSETATMPHNTSCTPVLLGLNLTYLAVIFIIRSVIKN